LALNKITKIPMIFFDETLIHIERDLSDAVTNILRESGAYRYIGVIGYHFVEGSFDKCITF